MASKNLNLIFNAKDNVSGVLGGISNKLKSQQQAFSTLAVAGGGAFASIGLAMKTAVGYAGELEMQTVAFETMLGSASDAQKLLKELSSFAQTTPFELQGVRQNAKQLLAMGIETDRLLPTLKALGDVSAGTSAPLERIALNFGQVKTQGKLTGRELRDFAVNGVPLIEELAKQFGVTKTEIQDMTSAGEIGFDAVEKAFISMTSEGGKFANLMDKQAKTFPGIISNLKDAMGQTAETVGMVLLPQIKELATKILDVVEKVKNWVTANPELTARILKMALVISGLIAGLGAVGLVLPTVIAGFSALMGPVGLVAVAIGLVVANWSRLVEVWNTVKEVLEDTGILTMFRDMWQSIVSVFRDQLLPELKKLWDMLAPVLKPLLEAMAVVIGSVLVAGIYLLLAGIKLWITWLGQLINWINQGLSWLKQMGEYVQNNLVKYFDNVANGIEYVVDKINALISALKKLKKDAGVGFGAIKEFFGGGRSRSVNDSIITDKGEVITTHPDDHIITTKDPSGLLGGGGGGSVVLNVDLRNSSLLSQDAGDQISQVLMKNLQLQMRGVNGL